jgi:hypothetical protein
MNKRTSFLLILLALAPAAFGQTIYRSTMPDGRTVLSDRPTPGAKKVEEMYVPRSAPSAPPSPAAKPAPPTSAAGGAKPPGQDPGAALDAAIRDLRAAEQALRAAEAARAAAEEPLENERQGMAGGGSRLNDAYFNRQKANADALEEARKRVDDAQAKVNSLR